MCFISKKLVDDIIYLVRSLGYYAKETKKTCINDANGPVTGTYYKFHICGNSLDEMPVLLKHKKAHPIESKKDTYVTGIHM